MRVTVYASELGTRGPTAVCHPSPHSCALKPALGPVQELSCCNYLFPGLIIERSLNGAHADMAKDTSLSALFSRGFDAPTKDNIHVFATGCKAFKCPVTSDPRRTCASLVQFTNGLN